MKAIDVKKLEKVTGGCMAGPNGEGCTCPRPKLGTPPTQPTNPFGNLLGGRQ